MSTDTTIEVQNIPVQDIYADESFNCRGYISPADVLELARDIEKHGLQQPISVQPHDGVPGKKYRIISGHRRFSAFLVNKAPTIPAIVREGIDEKHALIMNLTENIQRKQLNILQEAKAIERLKLAGMTQDDVARELGTNRPWVQVRYYLLDLPSDIQEMASDGYLTQQHIHDLNKIEDTEELYDVARQIKDQKIKSGKKRFKVKIKKKARPEDMAKAEHRDQDQINIMLDHLLEHGEPGLHTRALAWAAGNISTREFLKDFKQYCDEDLCKPYHVPTVMEGL